MEKLLKKEDGLAIVEATMLLPFCIIIIIALFYAAIFMCQRANLQANIQNTLIHYKNIYSDNYIEPTAHMSYSADNTKIGKVGTSYTSPEYKFPYRFLIMKFDESGFKNTFHIMCKNMFFDDGSNVTVDVKKSNYIIYKTITATASQTVKPALNLAMVGGSNELNIAATGKVVITDGDDMIRNIDFTVDIVNQTKFGKRVAELVDKADQFYKKFKSKFNISD